MSMISVVDKTETLRWAKAQALVTMAPQTLARLKSDDLPKPGVLPTARAAALLAAKRTPDLIPHCHPLPLESIEVDFELLERGVRIQTQVTTIAKTGVEMEALTAASTAALVIYDMLKAVDGNLAIEAVRLLEKTGGKTEFGAKSAAEISVAVLFTASDDLKSCVQERLAVFGVREFESEILHTDPQVTLKKYLQRGIDLIFTVGGSGLDPYDQTVDAVAGLIEREVPGVMEAARAYGQRRTPYAMLSRGVAGQSGRSMLVTLPGSSKGVQDSLMAIMPGLLHGLLAAKRKAR